MWQSWPRCISALMTVLVITAPAFALDPAKGLTQYSRTVWTQQQGLPQNTVRAIAQTLDGFLWIGTDEGVAKFDGYEFTTFTKDNSELPSNTIHALGAAPDGSLWIATPKGLAQYKDGTFSTYGRSQGLEDDSIAALLLDREGAAWVVTNGNVSRFHGGTVAHFRAGQDVPIQAVRSLTKDTENRIYAIGWSGVARFEDGKFISIAGAEEFGENLPQSMIVDHGQGFWIVGTRGLAHRAADGRMSVYRSHQGLYDAFGVYTILEDRNANIWVGTDDGLARLENGRFRTSSEQGLQSPLVLTLFEDREGNLWAGTDGGLLRLRDEVFTVIGKPEGLESDQPNTLFQDQSGRVWAGFIDGGMAVVAGSPLPAELNAKLPAGRVFSIRGTKSDELLVAARDGLIRIRHGQIRTYVPPDPLGRKTVYDAIETTNKRLWLALPNGLAELTNTELRYAVDAGTSRNAFPTVLAESRDGSLWAGTEGRGLLHIYDQDGTQQTRRFTTADGLGSDSIRSLYEDSEGTLWIGTIGGGLNGYREGVFVSLTAKSGLASDNVTGIVDGEDSLWLSTPRGILAIPKRQLEDYISKRIPKLQPIMYGLADGLRSAESPMMGGGGFRHLDGSLWFTTNRGIAVYRPQSTHNRELPPLLHILSVRAGEHSFALNQSIEVEQAWGSPQIRYAAIHLSAPDQIQYWQKLEGLDTEWTNAGTRRAATYPRLSHGSYIFHLKAQLPDGTATTTSLAFSILPRYYETLWFRLFALALVAGAVWGAHRFRVHQVRIRFQTVLEERARLAREVHDTLAQGFVGISSQLAVVESYMPLGDSAGRESLEMAQRMAQHSLTEARRSVADLRATVLDDFDLGGALKIGTHQWTAGSGVEAEVRVNGDAVRISEDVAHHLLRIAQEAVNNVTKHAGAEHVCVELNVENERVELRILDDGSGFEVDGMLATHQGNFGLMGMQERASRIDGEFVIESNLNRGTEITVTVPLGSS